MQYPKVSVVVTTYNRPKSLQAMLEHLRAQQHINWDDLEVIIMDDGSVTDPIKFHSPELWPFEIVYEYHQRGEGPQLYSLKNRAVDIAKNPVIWMLDDDLIFDRHTLIILRTIHALLEDIRPVVLPHYSDAAEPHHFQNPFPLDVSPEEKTHWVSFAGLSLWKKDFLKVGGIDENYDGAMGFADLDLGIRLHKDGCCNIMVDGVTCHIDDAETGSWRHQFLENHQNGKYFLNKWGLEEAAKYDITP